MKKLHDIGTAMLLCGLVLYIFTLFILGASETAIRITFYTGAASILISKQLAAVEHEIKIRSTTFEDIKANLSLAFELIEDCGRTYSAANDNIKRLMIQAVFSKIWIDEDGKTSTEYTNVYDSIVGPIETTLMKENIKLAPAKADANFIDKLLKSYSKFFEKGLNNELLSRVSKKDEFSQNYCRVVNPCLLPVLRQLSVTSIIFADK